MPYANGQIIDAGDGEPHYRFIALDSGWLTAVSIFTTEAYNNVWGPSYSQIFLTFGAPSIYNKTLILVQGMININDTVHWTGKQLVEEGMHLGFTTQSHYFTLFNFAYFIEKICPIPDAYPEGRTDRC